MKKNLVLLVLACNCCLLTLSQGKPSMVIHGKVNNDKNELLADATVSLKGGTIKTLTDKNGEFRLNIISLPVTLEISFAEFETQELVVTNEEAVSVTMEPVIMVLNPVTVGATRSEIRYIKTPVSDEHIGRLYLINTPSESYWGSILMKKGMIETTSSLTYKSFSTRGFNGSGNSRTNQFMDGMDNQAPGLNFSIGNFIGLTELDVDNIEILPGASSALYGAGGMNGTILVNSKNPFKYPGLSILVKQGITDIGKDQRHKPGGYIDYSLRWARKLSDRFAFKVGVQYVQAKDWLANDSTDYLRTGSSGNPITGNRKTDPNYDGVNVYGDETTVDLNQFLWGAILQNPGLAPVLQPLLGSPQKVSRTGYNEKDIIDPKTWNLKLSGALHYKLTNTLEAQLMGYWGTGNTVYTGSNRYAFNGIKMGQYKLELKDKNWFLRGYTTQENAGKAYSATVTSQIFNEGWKRSYDPANINNSWYPQYAGAFVQGAANVFTQAYTQALMSGQTQQQATITAQAAVVAAAPQLHIAGRDFADQGRPVPGSAQFKQIFDQVRNIPIPNGGLFTDQSQLWMAEGQYNLSDKIKFAEIIVGADLKKYVLNSQGTIFIDTAGTLKVAEWGSYAQITKKLFDDKLTLSASERYDKNENFTGKFTPRITALIAAGKDKNIRMSYQTAYRFPTNTQQWIKLDVGSALLLGGLPWIKNYLNTKSTPTYILNPNTGQTSPYTYKDFKPESLRSFEIGYKGLIGKKLLIDAYTYFGRYSDFLGRILLVQPNVAKPFSIVTNSDTKIKTWGMGIGVDYRMAKNYALFFNAYTDKLTNVPVGFEAGFNTPPYMINAGFGNTGLGKKERVGFNINLRWQDAFFCDGGGFANGTVKAFSTLDAQVNYKLPKIKSMVKLGGTNITNKFYQTSFGNPYIGGLYYVSFAYNIL